MCAGTYGVLSHTCKKNGLTSNQFILKATSNEENNFLNAILLLIYDCAEGNYIFKNKTKQNKKKTTFKYI